MNAMTESRWATGTYEILIEAGEAVLDGDVGITVFATPLTLDRADDEDAPILAQMEAQAWELGGVDPDTMPASELLEIGEHGLKPEDVEEKYGPELGLRILNSLYEAAMNDHRGTDRQGRPWRQPSPAVEPFMERVLDLIVLLTTRLSST